MVDPHEIAEIEKIARHIRERLAKSTLDSPLIAISRDGWRLILETIEIVPQIIEGLQDVERALTQVASDVSRPAEPSTSASAPR